MKIPFKRGIKRITNKNRHGQALYAFRRFLEEEFESPHYPKKYRDPEIRAKTIDELIAAYERDGFTEEEIEIQRAKYQSHPRRKPRPRKKVKKGFDANGIPKMTKTPLDSQLSAILAGAKLLKAQGKL